MRNAKGQSTIEFILTFTTSIGFIFLFLKMALNYTNGYMVHHATFMAARAYLVNDEERQSSEDSDARALAYAKKVFVYYMPEGLVKGVTQASVQASGPAANNALPVFTGIIAEFSQLFSTGFIGGKTSIPFTSEAFLGREVTRRESVAQTCNAIKESFSIPECNVHTTLEDNGG